MKTYLSYGGGVNSTAMMVMCENRINEAVFVDHGGDYPETYEYVQYMINQGFPITVIKPDVQGHKSLYDFCMENKIVPSRRFRWCTDKFKIKPIVNYIDAPCRMLIGFCLDEKKRVKSEFRFSKEVYAKFPLITEGVTRKGCKKIISDAGLKVPRKSCCFFCPFMKKLEAREMFLNRRELYEKAKCLEKNCMRDDIFIGNRPIEEVADEYILPLSSWCVENKP